MDVHKVLKELREERQLVEEAVLSLERLAFAGARNGAAGRPKWMTEARKAGVADKK